MSRIPRFHGRGHWHCGCGCHAREFPEPVDRAEGSNVRVFGWVATGTEHAESDIDLLFDMGTPMGLMELGGLERRLSGLLGSEVDMIPAATLRPDQGAAIWRQAGD